MSRSPLALAAALLAVPVALGVLPAAVAAPPECKPKKSCATPPAEEQPAEQPAPSATASRVVVAVVDSGVNPYHEAYYDDPVSVTPDVLDELGVAPGNVVELTRTGDLAADLAADRDFWDSVEPGTPYWFQGTNLVGVSFDEPADDRTLIFSDEGDEHGTGTTSAVLDANPEAVVLFVEGVNADAETFAFTHRAVDVVSTSYGFPGSPPLPWHLESSYTGVVEHGKLHYGAADNSPALSPPDGTSGPWWSIGVAGFHEDTSRGRETMSGNLVDVVSDFTQDLPYCSDCEKGRESVSGTSFATPRSAGTASKVLLEARRAAGHVGGVVEGSMVRGGGLDLTNWELRRAFEEAAHYPSTADYDTVEGVLDGGALPVLDPAPYLQTGWGVFSPANGVVDEALAQAGVAGTPRAAKSAEACAFNNGVFEARKAYWDNVAIGSESFLTTEDPYLRC